jgi:hypothetical protein
MLLFSAQKRYQFFFPYMSSFLGKWLKMNDQASKINGGRVVSEERG